MGKMGLGQITQNLCNCVSRTLTKTINGTLRDYLDNLGRQLTIASVCTMRYYKCQEQLSVNCDLWAWDNADGSITQSHYVCHNGEYSLPQA